MAGEPLVAAEPGEDQPSSAPAGVFEKRCRTGAGGIARKIAVDADVAFVRIRRGVLENRRADSPLCRDRFDVRALVAVVAGIAERERLDSSTPGGGADGRGHAC